VSIDYYFSPGKYRTTIFCSTNKQTEKNIEHLEPPCGASDARLGGHVTNNLV